jgi:uncharacterized membrane protein YebE (DUF533 family)
MKSNLMKKTFGILALSIMGLAATGAQAAWDRGGQGHKQAYQQTKAYSQQINARQDRQMQQIQAAKRKGNLSHRGFRALMQEQHDIRAMEQRFRADGVIDTREFKRIDRALDSAHRNIQANNHARHSYGQKSRFN